MSLVNLIEFLTKLFGDRDEQVKFENDLRATSKTPASAT